MAILSLIDDNVDKHEFEFHGKETIVGRVNCEITVKDRSISRQHAKIIFKNSGYEIQDLNSRNGTFINGKKIHHSLLTEGDHIRLGKKLFHFYLDNSKRTLASITSVENKTSTSISKDNIIPLNLPLNSDSKIALTIKNAVDTIFKIITKAESVTAHLFKNNKKDLYCFTSKNRSNLKKKTINVFSKSILDYVSKKGKTISADDAQHDDRFNCTDSIVKWKIRSVICTPIIAKNRLAGIIQANTSKANHKFTAAEMALMDFVGGSLSIVIENILLRETIKDQEGMLQKALKQMESTQNMLMHNDKLALVGRLSTGILHDVKNPLGAMVGYTGLVKEMINKSLSDFENKDGIKDNLRLLEEGTNHCYELINQILDFARQKQEPAMFLDLNQVIETTTDFLSYELNKNHVKLIKDFDLKIPLVKAHPNQLKQVFINLIINAVQAMNQDKNTIKIKTGMGKKRDSIIIKIKDNGVGMTEDVRKKIFQPFYTTKNTQNQYGGTGLGLTVCKEIIRLHGGTIKVKSNPGQGTLFTIKLPVS